MNLDLDRVIAALPDWAFPSKCTILSPTKTTSASSGKETRTYTTKVYEDVECRKAPNILVRPVAGETRNAFSGPFVRERNEESVLLRAYCPLITLEMRANIDGVLFEILRVDHDGNLAFTWLNVADIRPYNP